MRKRSVVVFLPFNRLRYASIHRIYKDNGRLCVEETLNQKTIYQEDETMTSSYFHIILHIQTQYKVNIWSHSFINELKKCKH